ncbi:sensor domain-containing diguanylate cyclase [Hungatella effluvii]|uniref:GGDEF domain-containing protein n=3 Tax=Lachnospiraceae TaxID=186803 RepID=A0A3E3DNN6_9FIRM|nr:diguanylate cyclase [Hungatella effluvii]RGD70912.1 GGDEF domain-containing protein [Hungatella hathewayi]
MENNTMFFKDKRKWIPFGILIVFVIGTAVLVRSEIQSASVQKRQKEAQTALSFFYENLSVNFEKLNYAKQLSYTDPYLDRDLTLFEQVSLRLLAEYSAIEAIAYFEGDTLTAVYPKEEYGEVVGKELREFSYSYTLAKVIKDGVIEGPEQLGVNQKDVFLFLYPMIVENEYKGEIAAALDRDYVISQMGLGFLEEAGYDYELWRVNSMGENKNVIAVSDSSIDFSDAVKFTFSLPAVWTLSIIPENGWFSVKQRVAVNVCCGAAALLIIALAMLAWRITEQKRELYKAGYTEPDSGLYTVEGFCNFVDRRIGRRPQTSLCVLYVRLSNFRRLSGAASREEVLAYLGRIRGSIGENFPAGTLAARLGEEVIAIALFEDRESGAAEEMIEEFVLQLFWKRSMNGKKEFVNPEYCTVSYPADGSHAAELLRHAAERFEREFKEKEQMV